MIDTFFFIINNKGNLEKVYFKAQLKNVEHVDYLSILGNLFTNMTRSCDEYTYKSSIDIRKIYKYKINELKLFFKEQIEFISYCDSKNNLENTLTELFNKSKIFFLKSKFESTNIEKFNKYRGIMDPNDFIDKIDKSIETIQNLLIDIQTKYHSITKEDYEVLRHKNNVLLNPKLNNFDSIVNTIKKRDNVSLVLFDLDIELSNLLINFYNLKFNKITEIPILNSIDVVNKLVYNLLNIQGTVDNSKSLL